MPVSQLCIFCVYLQFGFTTIDAQNLTYIDMIEEHLYET